MVAPDQETYDPGCFLVKECKSQTRQNLGTVFRTDFLDRSENRYFGLEGDETRGKQSEIFEPYDSW